MKRNMVFLFWHFNRQWSVNCHSKCSERLQNIFGKTFDYIWSLTALTTISNAVNCLFTGSTRNTFCVKICLDVALCVAQNLTANKIKWYIYHLNRKPNCRKGLRTVSGFTDAQKSKRTIVCSATFNADCLRLAMKTDRMASKSFHYQK